jgi:dephospho-CoA kinase
MIISIRGTNGAGKSTLVREIMSRYEKTLIQYPAKDKRKPMGYVCSNFEKTKGFFVAGHYEIANGGIDTLPSLECAYDLALKHHQLGLDVILEGKNFTEPPTWILKQHEDKVDIRVVLIDIPLSQCIKAVRARGHKIKEDTIAALHAKSRKQFEVFKKAGVHVFKGNRKQCLEKVASWLRA